MEEAVALHDQGGNIVALDEDLKREFTWHAASGKRWNSAKDFWQGTGTRFSLFIFVVLARPLFHLTYTLLKIGDLAVVVAVVAVTLVVSLLRLLFDFGHRPGLGTSGEEGGGGSMNVLSSR